MAITKTHPIKSTLKAAIAYICDPAKTDGKLLVSSFDCLTDANTGRTKAKRRSYDYGLRFTANIRWVYISPGAAGTELQFLFPPAPSDHPAHSQGVRIPDN